VLSFCWSFWGCVGGREASHTPGGGGRTPCGRLGASSDRSASNWHFRREDLSNADQSTNYSLTELRTREAVRIFTTRTPLRATSTGQSLSYLSTFVLATSTARPTVDGRPAGRYLDAGGRRTRLAHDGYQMTPHIGLITSWWPSQ